MNKKWFCVLSILCIISLPLHAQNELSKVATGTAQFLKLGAGARGTALGDAYTAMVKDVSAMYWNPAGLQKIGKISLGVAQTDLYAGITYNFLGVSVPINSANSIGISVLHVSSGDIELTRVESPMGTGEFFDTGHTAVGLSFARSLTERFDLGITLKYISERLYREQASTIAFDVGSQFDTGIYGLKIGMLLANFGGKMKFDGPDLNTKTSNPTTGASYDAGGRLKTEEWPIPLIFRLGLMIDLLGSDSKIMQSEKNRVTLALEGNDPVDHYLHYNFGLEYEWNEILALRAGYKSGYDAADYTAGFGLDFRKVGVNARLDYAFNNYGILGYVHNYSLEFHF